MQGQTKRVEISENLQKVFTYAFIESAPYSFFIPTKEKYVAVHLAHKIYHCLKCGEPLEVHYNQAGAVHFSKERFETQKMLYAKRGLAFPDEKEIEDAQVFTCHEEGYCRDCAQEALVNTDTEQALYNLCLKLHQRDEAVLDEARIAMGESVRIWVETITSSEQLTRYDLSSYMALKDLVCAVILQDVGGLERCLMTYRKDVDATIAEANELLESVPDKWISYAARPTTIYESMSDELYHEYTVAFPVKETKPQIFYVKKSMEKSRVRMFLEQVRLQTLEELILDVGFQDVWVDRFISHATNLKK